MLYRSLTNLNRNGQIIKPGDTVEIPESEARTLLKSGAIEPIHKPFKREVFVPGAAP